MKHVRAAPSGAFFRLGLAAVTFGWMLAAAPLAQAQCTTDIECKGDRICQNGQCVDPYPGQVRPPPPADPYARPPSDPYARPNADPSLPGSNVDTEAPPARSGWTLPAGIIGAASSIAIASLGIMAAEEVGPGDDDLHFGIAATSVLAVSVPVTFVGAHSGSGRGLVALEVVGWITYGLGLVNALSLIALEQALDETELDFEPWIISTTILGTVSATSMAVSAFVAFGNSQASGGGSRYGLFVQPVRGQGDRAGASLGLSMSW